MSELVLTLRQPAQIGDRSRDDFVLSTLEYIPGTVVRGAFAASWLVRNGVSAPATPERAEFLRLFEGAVRFGALLRPGTEFAPLSLVGHKQEPRDTCGDKEWDEALSDEVPDRCPDCDSPLTPVRGLRGDGPPRHRRTSVSIAGSGVAISGALFTRETLGAGQAFRGTLVAPDAASLDTLAGLGPVRVGGRRTTHGMAEIAVGPSGPPPTAQRRDEAHLVLRLRSPGIFTDNQGRPSRDPGRDELTEVLGTPARVVRRWTRWQEVGGWHIASGLPKPSELAVAAGSTYLIHAERAVDDPALENLGRRGVGLRRHEGFGDLAPPPVLAEGMKARQAAARERQKLSDAVAALRGVPARWPERAPGLLAALTGHANGDAEATGRLRRIAGEPWDAEVGAAVSRFLGYPPQEAAFVVEELIALWR